MVEILRKKGAIVISKRKLILLINNSPAVRKGANKQTYIFNS